MEIKLKYLISSEPKPDSKVLQAELSLIERLWGVRYDSKDVGVLKNPFWKDLVTNVCSECYFDATELQVIDGNEKFARSNKLELREKLLGEYKYNTTISKVIKEINIRKLKKEKENEDQGTFDFDAYRSVADLESSANKKGSDVFLPEPKPHDSIVGGDVRARIPSLEVTRSIRKPTDGSVEKSLVERSAGLPGKSLKAMNLILQSKSSEVSAGNLIRKKAQETSEYFMTQTYAKRVHTIETDTKTRTTLHTSRNPFSKKFMMTESNKNFAKTPKPKQLDSDFPRPLDPKNLLKIIEIGYRKAHPLAVVQNSVSPSETLPHNSSQNKDSPDYKRYETCYNRLKRNPLSRAGSGFRRRQTPSDVSKDSEKFARPRSERYGKIVSNLKLKNFGAEKLKDFRDRNLEKLKSFELSKKFSMRGNVGFALENQQMASRTNLETSNVKYGRLIETIESMKKMVKRDLG